MPSDAPTLAFFYDGNRMMGWSEQDGPYWHGTGSSVEDRLYEAIEGMAELHARLVDNEATLAARDAEIARLHERLEDNRVWQINPADPDGPLIRVEVEPGSIPDGIYCRDETIRLQDAQIDKLRAERGKAREALRLAARAILAWVNADEDICDLEVDALRAIVAILPDALDGAPEWIVEAVKQEKPE